ncbi:MAG: T9SS type A sorting domain-containing protein [Candidatus Cloacimonas sp.]
MKKMIILLALLATLPLWGGDITGDWQDCYTATLEQLQMITQSAGQIYGVGWKCFVRSTDGINFQNTIVDDRDSLFLESSYMISSTVGYCGGYIYHPSDWTLTRPVLYKTTNGGQSWVRTGQLEQQPGYYVVNHIEFINGLEGYVVLNALIYIDGLKIYRTTNGGQNWTLVYGLMPNCFTSADFSAGLMIVGQNAPDGALVSSDGLNWQFHQVGWSGVSYAASALVREGRLIVRCGEGLLYSDNAGDDWVGSDQSQLGDNFSIGGCMTDCTMTAIEDNVYVVAGTWDGNDGSSGIIRSLNNGSSWQWIVQPADMPDQSGQIYGICYWSEYIYIAHNAHIYRMYVGPPVANDDPSTPAMEAKLTCYPNPFRGSTNIQIKQDDNSPTTIAVYNFRGQLIRTVVNQQVLSPGEHTFVWDGKTDEGKPVAAGIYFCKVTAGSFSSSRKIVMLK